MEGRAARLLMLTRALATVWIFDNAQTDRTVVPPFMQVDSQGGNFSNFSRRSFSILDLPWSSWRVPSTILLEGAPAPARIAVKDEEAKKRTEPRKRMTPF